MTHSGATLTTPTAPEIGSVEAIQEISAWGNSAGARPGLEAYVLDGADAQNGVSTARLLGQELSGPGSSRPSAPPAGLVSVAGVGRSVDADDEQVLAELGPPTDKRRAALRGEGIGIAVVSSRE